MHRILEQYLARTCGLAEQAIFNWENSARTKFANRLQTGTESADGRKENPMVDKGMDGAPEEISNS